MNTHQSTTSSIRNKMQVTKVAVSTNDDYHKQLPFEEHYFSSSQLKTMLKDGPQEFHRQYVLGNVNKVSTQKQGEYDLGTAYHTQMLEPHLFNDEIMFFRHSKNSNVFKKLKKDNPKKIILGNIQEEKFNRLVRNTENSPECMALLKDFKSEESFYYEIDGFRRKCRTDILTKTYMADLKSTVNDLYDIDSVNKIISDLGYDLAAAYYMDIVNVYRKERNLPLLTKYYWIFASKESDMARKVEASELTLKIGRAKYQKAIDLINENKKRNWEFNNGSILSTPTKYDMYWLERDKLW